MLPLEQIKANADGFYAWARRPHRGFRVYADSGIVRITVEVLPRYAGYVATAAFLAGEVVEQHDWRAAAALWLARARRSFWGRVRRPE